MCCHIKKDWIVRIQLIMCGGSVMTQILIGIEIGMAVGRILLAVMEELKGRGNT
jgi:hypothetical protein